MISKLKPKSDLFKNIVILIFLIGTTQVFSDNFFVSEYGNNLNDCKSEKTSCKTIQKSVNLAKAGDTVYVKAGKYGNEKITFPRSGTKDKPIIVEGYKKITGDKPIYKNIDANLSFNPLLMPLLDGKNSVKSRAFLLHNKQYIEIRHFQIKGYNRGVFSYGGTRERPLEGNHFSYIYVRPSLPPEHSSENWDYGVTLYTSHKNSSIKNCVVINADGDSILSYGNHNQIINNHVYSTQKNMDGSARDGTDYYITIRGNFNIINDNLILSTFRTASGNRKGHGVSIVTDKNGNWNPDTPEPIYNTATNNVIKNNTIIGSYVGLELRHNVKDNVCENNTVINVGKGIKFQDGASGNIVRNTKIIDTKYPISFVETKENGLSKKYFPMEYNLVNGVIIEGISGYAPILIDIVEPYKAIIRDNVIQNIMGGRFRDIFIVHKGLSSKMTMENNKLIDLNIEVKNKNILSGWRIGTTDGK